MTKEITITIQTTQGDWETSFNQITKVSSVIEATIKHFDFAQNGNYVLTRNSSEEELKPQRPLISYQIENGEILTLTDLGVAV